MDEVSFKEMLANVGRAVTECQSVPAWALSESAKIDRLNWTSAVLQRLEELKLILLREIDSQGIAIDQGATGTAEWLQDRYGISAQAAAGLVMLARSSTPRATPH